MLNKIKLLLVIIGFVIFLSGCDKTGDESVPQNLDWRDSTDSFNPTDLVGTASGPSMNNEFNPSKSKASGVKQLAGGGIEIEGVPLYRQGGSDLFSPGGSSWRPGAYCGPTSFQMVMSYYGINKSRDYWALTVPGTNTQVKSSADKGQMYLKDQGAAYGNMVKMAKAQGFSKTQQKTGLSVNGLKSLLDTGRPQIVSIGGSIKYNDGYSRKSNGHVIVVTGYTGKGDLIVQDPATGRRHEISPTNFNNIWRKFSVDIQK